MWKIVYNILIHSVLPVFFVFSFFKKKLRKNFIERLLPHPGGPSGKQLIWIHAASVGEAMIAENILKYMLEHTTLTQFMITTNTYYTKDYLDARVGSIAAIYALPFDLPFSVRHFLKTKDIAILLIIETEIWPNLIWQTKKRGIPIAIVNGRISDSTYRQYKRLSFFFKAVLSDIDYVLAQSEEHRERFIGIGVDSAKVTNAGNIKYYRDIDCIHDSCTKDNIITYGSIKELEVPILYDVIKMINDTYPSYKHYIAPRELHLINVMEDQFSSSFHTIRYTMLKKSSMNIFDTDADVVIVDTVGDLLDIYKKSRIAFVGGSLAPYGGQNMLEPLFFGVPVLFGPHVENFREISHMIIDANAGIQVSTGEELYQNIVVLLQDERMRIMMGKAGMEIIEKQKKVMEKTVQMILETMVLP